MTVLHEEVIRFIAKNLKCSICFDMFVHPVTLTCGHNYCLQCINDYLQRGKNRDCPQCRAPLHQDYKPNKNVNISNILDLNEAGGREMWDQILPEQKFSKDRMVHVQDTLKRRLDFFMQEIKKIEAELNFDNQDRTDESSSSSLLSPSLLPSSSLSSPSLSSPPSSLPLFSSLPLSSSSSSPPSSSPSSSPSSLPSLSTAAAAEVASSSLDNSTQNTVDWEPNPALSNEFVMLSFSPKLGHQRLVFYPESRRMEVTSPRYRKTQHCRFDVCQCMADQEFSTGRHYWNVDTGRCIGWAIGVAYAHLKKDEQLGRSKDSWCIEWSSGKFSAWHDSTETLLEHRHPNRVRVLLDMDNGDLSFWCLTEEEVELYSIKVEFRAPVHPMFWLFGMKIGNALSFPTP